MADDTLIFPRLIYRGEPDTLGLNDRGETVRCEDAADWASKKKQGWRLTREMEEPKATAATADAKGKK